MTRRWFDRWQRIDPESRCHCGHLLRRHPPERFRSCSDCVWCDDFREPPVSQRPTSSVRRLSETTSTAKGAGQMDELGW